MTLKKVGCLGIGVLATQVWIGVNVVGGVANEVLEALQKTPGKTHHMEISPFFYRSCTDIDGNGIYDRAVRLPFPANVMTSSDERFFEVCNDARDGIAFGISMTYTQQ